ncbi:hypothetical protein [Aeromonas veronii]|uniref:hypothetical protein n=1 Tax=Aeromonas veronii TaxID=654 RepID=UPI003D1BBC99
MRIRLTYLLFFAALVIIELRAVVARSICVTHLARMEEQTKAVTEVDLRYILVPEDHGEPPVPFIWQRLSSVTQMELN